MSNIIAVPLNKLTRSARNVRKSRFFNPRARLDPRLRVRIYRRVRITIGISPVVAALTFFWQLFLTGLSFSAFRARVLR